MQQKPSKTIDLTIIIPAYNEAGSIADTIASLHQQQVRAKKIVVVDDCSTDNTGKIAQEMGVTVLRPLTNTGTKAGAQNLALKQVNTKYVMAVDADTTLEHTAIERLSQAMIGHKAVAAACGFVVPRFVHTLWERGRYIEYLLAFTYYKPIQDYFGKPMIASGCFSIYQTAVLKRYGGWPTRTMAEDMDLTWTFYRHKHQVRFVPEAVCYPIDPETFDLMRKQLKRWSHGFVQNVLLHWRDIVQIPYLNLIVAVSLWDGLIASVAYLFLLPLLTIYFQQPLLLLGYIIDAPLTFVPVFFKGLERREIGLVLSSFPAFFALRFVNAYFMVEAYWSEWVLGKRLTVYEKGH